MTDSEFRAYTYIEEVLGKLGWDTRNPRWGGQVYTQGEFRKHDSLLEEALGKKSPENVIVIPWEGGHRYWVVEAKPTHRGLIKALSEAKDYADSINKRKDGLARFATGVAGNREDSFYVSTVYWDGQEWSEVAINKYGTTGFLALEQCQSILDLNSPNILDYHVDLKLFLEKANDINTSLHHNGVSARDRAKLVAGLLLALAEDSTLRISRTPRTLVGDINSRIEALLDQHSKEGFLSEVQLKLPANNENHRKYWSAIVETMQHLREMNIRSATLNSGTDALGQFYETFLKYANDASEMGIVLTPRHVTKFAVDVLNIEHEHAIYDPTCGTGGFLVAALDQIRARHSVAHRDVYDKFRNDYLHGVEQADDVFGLALVNMIFRGDGKSRIYNGNCFDSIFVRHNGQIIRIKKDDDLPPGSVRPFSRVLMNPPFALKEPEYQFVNHALNQTAAGGLLFAVLPNAVLTGLQAEVKKWREELVRRHTVRAVIKMPRSLFHPAADKITYALVVEAWRSHEPSDPVFMAIFHDDDSASRLSKFRNLQYTKDNVGRLSTELRSFMVGSVESVSDIPQESGVRSLSLRDSYDFAPEAYLSNEPDAGPSPPEGLFMALMRDTFRQPRESPAPIPENLREYRLDELFEITKGNAPPLKHLSHGETPIVTTTEKNNGISGYYEVDHAFTYQDAVTITANGSGGKAFWHPYRFAASADVLVCRFRDDFKGDVAFKLYVCDAINQNAWRFTWRRKCSAIRLLTDVRVALPMTDNKVDFNQLRKAMQGTPGYYVLTTLLPDS